jgi:hypothetical protein
MVQSQSGGWLRNDAVLHAPSFSNPGVDSDLKKMIVEISPFHSLVGSSRLWGLSRRSEKTETAASPIT